jgi:osmotically-inducible protein OsmY
MKRKSDSAIQQDVLRELKWDTRVEETEVGVQVDDGVVTLSGNVSSWAKRVAAQEAAHRVSGVLDVVNDLTIKVPGRGKTSDTEIAHAVRHALLWDAFVPEERIRSTVSDGKVTLEGEVSHWSEREDAEKAVRNLAGIRWLNNDILVSPPVIDSDEMRRSIENALERQAERDARSIALDVKDGRVALSGSVQSLAEKQAALAVVKNTPGVRGVDDHLSIARAEL